jgi:hypothetical protein
VYTRGSAPLALSIATNSAEIDAAVADFEQLAYSATTRGPRTARLRLWATLMARQGIYDPFHLTLEMVTGGAAILHRAGYRSTMAYVDLAKHCRRGG